MTDLTDAGDELQGLALRGRPAACLQRLRGRSGEKRANVLFEDRLTVPRASRISEPSARCSRTTDDPPRLRGDLGRAHTASSAYSDRQWTGCARFPTTSPDRGRPARPSAEAADRRARSLRHPRPASAITKNAMLRRFLDTFGFEYEFISATEFYRSGQFDEVLRRAVDRYERRDGAGDAEIAARGAPADLFHLSARPPPRRAACSTCR